MDWSDGYEYLKSELLLFGLHCANPESGHSGTDHLRHVALMVFDKEFILECGARGAYPFI